MRLLLIIITLLCFGCQEDQPTNQYISGTQKSRKKIEMTLDVVMKQEVANGYTISWYDTLGKYQNLNKMMRPFEINCDILDLSDTAGYYHGMRNPSTWTSFGTKDSVVTVYFYIVRNKFSEMPSNQQMNYPDISCNFLPVTLSTKSHLEERITLTLTER